MKFLIKSLVVSFIVALCRAASEKLACHMVSLEIENDLTGYCCILVKNISDNDIQIEEIKGQLLEHLTNDTIEEVFNRNIENEENENGDAEGKTPSNTTEINNLNIKFPGATNYDKIKTNITEQRKTLMENTLHLNSNTPTDYKKKLVSEAIKNNDTSSAEVKDSQNVTLEVKPDSQNNDTVTVIPANRNAVDTPEICPDGKEKDHNGKCVPVF